MTQVPFHTLPNLPDGTIDLEEVRSAIRPADAHFTVAKLLVLENTHNRMGGAVLPLDYMARASALCKEVGLALHIDGARLWNAAQALGVSAAEVAAGADSVSVCLSKGLGCPVGSVLVGTTEFIKRARRLRKAVGGGMRQVGVLAAAGLYALDHHMERLKEDHENARAFADGLSAHGVSVIPPQSNIVIFDVDNGPKFVSAMAQEGVCITCSDGKRRCRAVANLMVTSEHISFALKAVDKILKSDVPEPAAKLRAVG